jgi:hypothetical protein
MDEATGFSNHSNIKWQGTTGVVEYGGGAKGQMALFYNRSVLNPALSASAGRPINEDRIYIRLQRPGERLEVVDRPATEQDKHIWALSWAQFQQNKQQTPEGTPIDLLYPEHPSIAANLRACGVHTIEQCAELSAHAIESIGMGAQRYVNDSQKYLKMAERGVKANEFRREIEERDSKIRVLTQQVEQLSAQVQQMAQNSANNVDMTQLQSLIAGVMGRPVHTPTPRYDAAAAQIAANHPTTDIAHNVAKRRRPRIRAEG